MEDQSNLVRVLSWFLPVVSALTTIARMWTKTQTSRRLDWDDAAVTAALGFNIGSSLLASAAGSNGLGDLLTDADRITYLKTSYVSQILTVPTLCCAKFSILLLLRRLFIQPLSKLVTLYFSFFLALWCVTCILVLAFQCTLPHAWNYSGQNCINLTAFWRVSGAINIVTDAALVTLPVLMLRRVQMPRQKKFIVIACFGARALDVVGSSVQLIYTAAFSASDLTASLWRWFICNVAVQTLTIVTSNIPYLKQLLEAFPAANMLVEPYEGPSHGLSYRGSERPSRLRPNLLMPMSREHQQREAYEESLALTRSTAQPVTNGWASVTAIHRPGQIHIRQSIAVEHQLVG